MPNFYLLKTVNRSFQNQAYSIVTIGMNQVRYENPIGPGLENLLTMVDKIGLN